eukprot:8934785-Heterocapsa_arctica.AAC.1
MGQAATRSSSKENRMINEELFKDNRKINPFSVTIGVHIFDALNGGRMAKRKGEHEFDMKFNSIEDWVPWSKVQNMSETTRYGVCSQRRVSGTSS